MEEGKLTKPPLRPRQCFYLFSFVILSMPAKPLPASNIRPCKRCHHRFNDHINAGLGMGDGSPGVDHSCTICTCTQFED